MNKKEENGVVRPVHDEAELQALELLASGQAPPGTAIPRGENGLPQAPGTQLRTAIVELTKSLETASEALRSLGIRVYARVPIEVQTDQGYEYGYYLAFDRFDGKWQLIVENDNELAETFDARPIARASAVHKRESARQLHQLRAAMKNAHWKALADIGQEILDVDAFAADTFAMVEDV